MLGVITLHGSPLVLALAGVVPVAVALVTKAAAPSWLKFTLLAVLSAVTALVIPPLQNGGSVVINDAFWGTFLAAVITAEVAHFGGKALGVTGSEGLVAQKVPGGLG